MKTTITATAIAATLAAAGCGSSATSEALDVIDQAEQALIEIEAIWDEAAGDLLDGTRTDEECPSRVDGMGLRHRLLNPLFPQVTGDKADELSAAITAAVLAADECGRLEQAAAESRTTLQQAVQRTRSETREERIARLRNMIRTWPETETAVLKTVMNAETLDDKWAAIAAAVSWPRSRATGRMPPSINVTEQRRTASRQRENGQGRTEPHSGRSEGKDGGDVPRRRHRNPHDRLAS